MALKWCRKIRSFGLILHWIMMKLWWLQENKVFNNKTTRTHFKKMHRSYLRNFVCDFHFILQNFLLRTSSFWFYLLTSFGFLYKIHICIHFWIFVLLKIYWNSCDTWKTRKRKKWLKNYSNRSKTTSIGYLRKELQELFLGIVFKKTFLASSEINKLQEMFRDILIDLDTDHEKVVE